MASAISPNAHLAPIVSSLYSSSSWTFHAHKGSKNRGFQGSKNRGFYYLPLLLLLLLLQYYYEAYIEVFLGEFLPIKGAKLGDSTIIMELL